MEIDNGKIYVDIKEIHFRYCGKTFVFKAPTTLQSILAFLFKNVSKLIYSDSKEEVEQSELLRIY